MATVREISEFDRVEILDSMHDAPAGATGGVLEVRGDGTAMVEVTTPDLEPAARIVFVPLVKLRRIA